MSETIDHIREQAEQLAKHFHELYEAKAPEFGYETRIESRTIWDRIKDDRQKALMIAVCSVIHAEHQAALRDVEAAQRKEAIEVCRAVILEYETKRNLFTYDGYIFRELLGDLIEKKLKV